MRFLNRTDRTALRPVKFLLVGSLLVIGACNAQNDELAEPQGAIENTTAPDPQAPDVAEPNRIGVELADYEIGMPDSITAGPTYFEVTNVGETEHNFEIEGQGIEQELDSTLAPNETGTLYVDLQPGTYTVYCPVANHAERGMVQELTVIE